jgi:AcrR family transcriptional regulator
MTDLSLQEKRRRTLNAAQDSRARQTRRKLVNALHELLRESPETLSVASLSERAGIGRSTFYTHFGTVEELCLYAIDRTFAELSPLDVERRRARESDPAEITKLGLGELLDQIAEQTGILALLSSGSTQWTIRGRFVSLMAASLRDTLLAERPDATEEFLRLAGEYIAGGVLRVFLDWLDDPRGLTRQQTIDIVFDLLPAWLSGA